MFETEETSPRAADSQGLSNLYRYVLLAFVLGAIFAALVIRHHNGEVQSGEIRRPSKYIYPICQVFGEQICCLQQGEGAKSVSVSMGMPPPGKIYVVTARVTPEGDVEYCQPYIPLK